MRDGHVMCRICKAAMRSTVAAAHLQTHAEAGDLIRAASKIEREELSRDDR